MAFSFFRDLTLIARDVPILDVLQLHERLPETAATSYRDRINEISWPACQPNCFAVGAVRPGKDEVYLDRHAKLGG